MRLLAVLVSLVLALPSTAQLRRNDVKSIDRTVVSTMKAFGIPGAAVAVVQNDAVVHLAGYGTKELGGAEPVGPDTLFQIASTTKAFTATALAMLVADGKASWDDPVRKHLPEFRLGDLCADSAITIRDLLSHRSGLRRHDELWDNSPITRRELLRSVQHLDLARPFRSGYQYQNILFVAAGEVVAAASGMPWDDFVRQRLLKPLGMNSTVLTDAEWEASDHATGYRYSWKDGRITRQAPVETGTLGAAGAIKSSARDMAQWLRFQLAGGTIGGQRLVDADILAETRKPHVAIPLENSTRDSNPETNLLSYGLGWAIQDYRGELLVSHSGALNGFRTHVDLLPKRRTGFVVMVNAGRGHAALALRNALVDLLTAKLPRDWNAYYLMVERNANEKEERDKQERRAKYVPGPASHPLQDYAGEYDSPSHGRAIVSVSDGTLVLQWSRITVALTHLHHDVFAAESEEDFLDEEVSFGMNGEGKVAEMKIFGVTFGRR